MMPLQRACVAESQVRNKLSNGPLRAQSKIYLPFAGLFGRCAVGNFGYVEYSATCGIR